MTRTITAISVNGVLWCNCIKKLIDRKPQQKLKFEKTLGGGLLWGS